MESIVSLILVLIGSLLSIVTLRVHMFIGGARRGAIDIGSVDLKDEQETELKRRLEAESRLPPVTDSSSNTAPGTIVLLSFAALVVIFGLVTLVRYWAELKAAQGSAFLAVWLFVAMVAGMFLRVIVMNYQINRRLFDVTATQLVFPVLFSVIVFYPIWAIGMSATDKVFALYAAFLNGFFWETVVTNVKPPAPGGTGGN